METPMLGRVYCPGCEPWLDPTREILDAMPCGKHLLGRAPDDERAAQAIYARSLSC